MVFSEKNILKTFDAIRIIERAIMHRNKQMSFATITL
jgi:hypothetical protein